MSLPTFSSSVKRGCIGVPKCVETLLAGGASSNDLSACGGSRRILLPSAVTWLSNGSGCVSLRRCRFVSRFVAGSKGLFGGHGELCRDSRMNSALLILLLSLFVQASVSCKSCKFEFFNAAPVLAN